MASPDPKSILPARRVLPLLVAAAVLVCVIAYGWTRYSAQPASPASFSPIMVRSMPIAGAAPAANPHAADIDQIAAMTDKLAAKLKEQPKDSEGWAMLARTYGVLKRFPEAVIAYEKAIALRGDDNVLRSDYAQARAQAGLPPDSRGVVVAQAVVKPQMAASTGQTVSGTVVLAPALMKQVNPEDVVFVFARPSEGSRMPLALLRRQVKDLPIVFTLDDSMAMSPASTLSKAGLVVIGARISKSGHAMPEKGDLTGLSAPVAVGAKGMKIEINEVLMQ
ncbi:hypothetical protein [Rhodoferax sp.]|uniref:tetratricopeptide repeat protein n=1 Tax=Rhodoferax sp. TaxID=50421 RepID=UPI002628EEDE|nr:hypothetical protein [Rhodoferax sp.]MDD2918185.1 hypothetical protein [Rhodoferax sp.]